MRAPSIRFRRFGVLLFGLAATAMTVACGGDDGETDTTAAPTTEAPSTEAPGTEAPTTDAPTTDGMGSNVESLSYLIQGLLTTEQIGGDWVDQGRMIVPPGSEQLTGFLCEQGEAAVAALSGRLDPQVSTTYQRAGDTGLSVSESLMWGDRDQLVADFDAFVSVVESCAGSPYTTVNLGELTLAVDEAPSLGTASVAFHFGPSTPPTDTPWLESQMTAVLLSDPGQPVALVVWVGTMTIHDPADLDVTELDPAEYTRIVEAAVSRIVDEGL